MLKLFERLIGPLTVGASVLFLAACGTSTPPGAVILSDVLGDTLPGARGATIKDQDRIDATLARACAAGAYERRLCAAHSGVTASHRKVLSAGAGFPAS